MYRRWSGESAIYKWSRPNNRPLPEGSEVGDYDRRLIIHNVKPEDEGDYICTVSSQQSSIFKAVTLRIKGQLAVLLRLL